ncbi:MAG: hypothetical protein V9G24_02650 [Rhodoblastus sp.]|jgi:hypothetical protein
MTEPERLKLDTIQAPFGREIRMDELRYESGMRILRVTIREGRRFTTLDLDPERARQFANALYGWMQSTEP